VAGCCRSVAVEETEGEEDLLKWGKQREREDRLLEKEGPVCGEEGALLLMVLARGGSAAIIWCSFGQGRGVVAGCCGLLQREGEMLDVLWLSRGRKKACGKAGEAEREEEAEGKTWGKGSSGLCEGKWSGSSCWKNEWGFVLLAGQGEENGGTEWKMKGNGAPVGVVQRL